MVNDAASERGSQAVHRVLRVLLCWTTGEPTRSLTEIAQDAGLTLPTAHRMIKALQREGFLAHDSASGRYGVGPTVMDLARVVLQRADQDELLLVTLPHLERIRAITGETVGLHLPMADSRICVAELVSREPTRTATGVGRTYKLPLGAAGQVLIAWSAERTALVQTGMGTTSSSAAARRALSDTTEAVRNNGYAISFGQTIPGASAIALPMFDSNAEVCAAVNVTGPATRWVREKMLEHLPEILAEVAQVEAQLGYRRPAAPAAQAAQASEPRARRRPKASSTA
jgi:DNA-binding IclR family transcriptional regulator